MVSMLEPWLCKRVLRLGNTHRNTQRKSTSCLASHRCFRKNKSGQYQIRTSCVSLFISRSRGLWVQEGVGVRSVPHTAVRVCLEEKPTHIAFGHWVWLRGYQVCLLGNLPTSSLLNWRLCFHACLLNQNFPLVGATPWSLFSLLNRLLSLV